jgi:hypothetical protein
MPLNVSLIAAIQGLLTQSVGLSEASLPLEFPGQIALVDGTGAGQANQVYRARRTLAASAVEDLDLSGTSLQNPFGVNLALARVKTVAIAALAGNTNNVVIGGAPTNAWVGPFGAATHTKAVRPGGFELWACSDVTGWPVTATTADLLRIANGGAGSTVTYDILVIGATA